MAISLSGLGVGLKRLFHGQPPITGATLYTCPAATVAQVASVRICNPSTSDLTVRLGIVPSGGSSDGTHYLLGDQLIPANTTYESDTVLPLVAGDVLEGQSAPLPAPAVPLGVASTTGGTLAAGNNCFKITATNANGETVASQELVVATTGSTGSVVLSWARSLGATGYKIYGSTSTGAEVLLAAGTISSGATTTATITTLAAAVGPVSPPTAGSAAGCIFTVAGAELTA